VVDAWKESESKKLVSTHVFEITERRSTNPRTGIEVPVYVLEGTDWVNVFPVTEAGEVVVVRQYRHGTRTITLEIPGGMAEPGEEPAEAARRELLEETGYASADGSLELLGMVHPNPAIQSNSTFTYLARGARKVAEPNLDSAEDIDIELVPLGDFEALIREGAVTHSLVVAAFYWLGSWRRQRHDELAMLEQEQKRQQDKVAALARRINAGLTAEDLRNPQDFEELVRDPDFNYQDGFLAGVESALMALRSSSEKL